MNIQQFLGVDLPIIQAPMAGVQGSAMAIAVSNAGGLGSLPCAMLTPEVLRSELEAITAQTTRPYNVNFFCHTPTAPDAAREAAWRAVLAPYYAEFGIDPNSVA
ncbi:MAG: 2-nitropropane dioxygenase, partial [Comamonadaceae bacterium]